MKEGKISAAIALLLAVFIVCILYLSIRKQAAITRTELVQEIMETTHIEQRSLNPGFDELDAIGVDSEDRIYVSGDSKVRVLDPLGGVVREFPLPEKGRCVAVSAQGEVYVGFLRHVGIFSVHGEQTASWDQIDASSYLTSIALSGDVVFVADAGTRSVWKFNHAGVNLGRIAEEDAEAGIPKLVVPSPFFDLAAPDDSSVWVVNPGQHKLFRFSHDGNLLDSWGTHSHEVEGFCGCCNPSHIALFEDGSFVTSEKGFVRVKTYDPKGNFTGLVASADQFQKGAQGLALAVDSSQRILVMDMKNKGIRVFVRK